MFYYNMCRIFEGSFVVSSLKIILKCTALILPMIAILKLPLSNEKTAVETNYINYYLIKLNLSSNSLFNFDDSAA